MEPLEAILRRIEAEGPMSFADYMAAALYGPGGFYDRHPVGRGPGSDFATGPHVSPVFAELLARKLERLSGNGRVRLVELGAGDGTLASQLRDVMGDRLDYTGVDISPGANEALQERGLRTATLEGAVSSGWAGVILAHELLDNLPFHWVRRRSGVLEEVMVGVGGDGDLRYEAHACPEPLARAAHELQEGDEGTVPTAAHELLAALADRVDQGTAVLIIDYESRGAPWGYLGHSRSEDLLEAPGSRDITSGLNFDALARVAQDLGFTTDGPTTQREALIELGYAAVDERLAQAQARAQDDARGREAVRTWNARREAASLVDPTGLGAHRWLILRLP